METNFTTLERDYTKTKETVFSGIVSTRPPEATLTKPTDFLNVLHIGYNKTYGDVFKCWDDDKKDFTLYFGEKGDEFN